MIAYLNGILAEKDITRVVVECGDVGYEVFIPISTFDRLLAAVPQTTMLAIDPTDASEELTMPADRALWVWLAGTGKYRPRLNGITIVFR